MKDDASSQGWELEEAGDVEDRWVLEESEQQLGDEWDLEGTPEPVGQWQPVEYDKPRRGGPAWILPTVVTVALLAVLGYSAVTLVPELVDNLREQVLGTGVSANEEGLPAEEVAADATEPAVVPAPTEEPTLTPAPSETPTEAPPTTMPSATLAVAQQLFARVLSEYGVNARSGPGIDFEVLQILDPEATFVVLDRIDDEWLQLFISDAPLESGQPVTGFVGYASSEFLSEAMQPFAEDLWLEVLAAAGITPTATPAPPAPTGADVAGGDTGIPTVTPGGPEASETITDTLAAVRSDVTVIIDAVNGLNVRTSPELNADVVTLLPDQSRVPAIGRYATNEWILVDLGDGARGWVFTELVQLDGDLASLPAITLGELAPPTATPTETSTPEPTPISAPSEPPAPYSSQLPPGTPGALIFSATGANARELPSADSAVITVIPENAALPVVARTSNGEWLQVELPQGGYAWIFRATVIPRGDLTTVPFSDGTDEVAPPTATPVPEEAAPEPTEAPAEEPTEVPAEPTAPAEGTEPTDDEPEPIVGATVVMRQVVVPVFDSPSVDGTKIMQYGRGTVIPATGRSADGAWIQVLATTGDAGWVAAKSVEASVSVDTLPVVE